MKNILDKHDKIAVDCDEVLSESYISIINYFNLKNISWNKIKFKDIKNINLSQNKWFVYTDEEFKNMFVDFFMKDENMLELPIVSWSLSWLKQLKNYWKKLYVITARQEFLENYTLKWLNKYFWKLFQSVIFCNHEWGWISRNKSDICKEIWANLIIEDNLDYALECAEKWIEVILFNKPWNIGRKETHKNIYRVDWWKDLI